MENVMPGTLTPEQMRMQAIIESLRQPVQQAAAPIQQQGRVQSATPDVSQMGGLSQGLGALGKGIGSWLGGSSGGPVYDTGV